MKKHSIRVVVQIGEDFGSTRISVEAPEDAFSGVDFGDLAHAAAEGVVAFLMDDDAEPEGDDEEILALSLLGTDDDDDAEGHGPN